MIFLYLFVPHSCNSHSFLPVQADILHWYYFQRQHHFFSTQCMELAHLPPGTTGWRFCSKIQSVSWVLGSWWVWLHLAIGEKREKNKKNHFFIIQNKQTAGIICEVNTLCMDNFFLLQSRGELLSVSFFVCFSLSLSVAVRLSVCISDKKLPKKGINTVT